MGTGLRKREYPEVKVLGANEYYANILLESYAGPVSELTAVTRFINHHLVIEDEEVSQKMIDMAMVDMEHLDLLGKTIKALGGDPVYTGSSGIAWNPGYVYYGSGLRDRLSADVIGLRMALEQYRRHQKLIQDPYVDGILEKIIEDEVQHIKILSAELRKYY